LPEAEQESTPVTFSLHVVPQTGSIAVVGLGLPLDRVTCRLIRHGTTAGNAGTELMSTRCRDSFVLGRRDGSGGGCAHAEVSLAERSGLASSATGTYERLCARGATVLGDGTCTWLGRALFRQMAGEAFLLFDGLGWAIARALPPSQGAPLAPAQVIARAVSDSESLDSIAAPWKLIESGAAGLRVTCFGCGPGCAVPGYAFLTPGEYQVCIGREVGLVAGPAPACRNATLGEARGAALVLS
jgi:hypothetical protein